MNNSRKKGGDTMKSTKTKSLRSTVNTGGKVIATTRKLMEAP